MTSFLRKLFNSLFLLIRWPVFFLRNNTINLSVRIGSHTFLRDCNIGHNVFIGQNCCISSANIGSYTCISWNAMIGGMEHDYSYPSINPILNTVLDTIPLNRTVIGNDVWIGANCVIRQGVTIGDGAVIGAGSVVTHDIPPYTIAYGSPARCIKKRFEEEMERKVIETCYWNSRPAEAIKKICEICDSKL